MAINRYNTPIQVDTTIPLYRPDWGIIGGAMQQLQGDYDVYNQAVDKRSPYIEQDQYAAQAIAEEYEGYVEDVADAYMSDIGEGRGKMANVLGTVRQDWNPGGRYATMQSRVAQLAEIDKQIDENSENPLIANYRKQYVRSRTQGIYDPNSKQWNINASMGRDDLPKEIPQEEISKFISDIAIKDLKETLLSDPNLPPNRRMLLSGANNIMEISRISGVTPERILNTLVGLIPDEYLDAMQLYDNSMVASGNQAQSINQRDILARNSQGQVIGPNTNTIIGRMISGAMAGGTRYSIDTKISTFRNPLLYQRGVNEANKATPILLPGALMDVTLDKETVYEQAELVAGAKQAYTETTTQIETAKNRLAEVNILLEGNDLTPTERDQITAEREVLRVNIAELAKERTRRNQQVRESETFLLEIEDRSGIDIPSMYDEYLSELERRRTNLILRGKDEEEVNNNPDYQPLSINEFRNIVRGGQEMDGYVLFGRPLNQSIAGDYKSKYEDNLENFVDTNGKIQVGSTAIIDEGGEFSKLNDQLTDGFANGTINFVGMNGQDISNTQEVQDLINSGNKLEPLVPFFDQKGEVAWQARIKDSNGEVVWAAPVRPSTDDNVFNEIIASRAIDWSETAETPKQGMTMRYLAMNQQMNSDDLGGYGSFSEQAHNLLTYARDGRKTIQQGGKPGGDEALIRTPMFNYKIMINTGNNGEKVYQVAIIPPNSFDTYKTRNPDGTTETAFLEFMGATQFKDLNDATLAGYTHYRQVQQDQLNNQR